MTPEEKSEAIRALQEGRDLDAQNIILASLRAEQMRQLVKAVEHHKMMVELEAVAIK